MFSKHLLPITLLICSCSFYSSGCDYEPNELKSRLELTTPCIPAANYFQAVEEYFSKKLNSYHSSVDQRSGEDKYKEITEQVRVARADLAHCLAQDKNVPELMSEKWKSLQLRLSRISGVTMVYEHWQKSWQDSDIDLFQRGLEGIEIKPDYSKMPMDDCEKECDK